jgi:uncharacterized lipoprotein
MCRTREGCDPFYDTLREKKVRRMKYKFLFLVTCGLLNACASQYSSNAEKAYLKAVNGPALVVPPPLSHQTISHFYDLPNLNPSGGVSIIPPVSFGV